MSIKLQKLVRKAERNKHALTVDGSDLVTELIDEYEHQFAILRSEAHSARRAYKKWYERNRLLENRIRALDSNYYGTMESLRNDLRAIVKRLPSKPRKKWGWRS